MEWSSLDKKCGEGFIEEPTLCPAAWWVFQRTPRHLLISMQFTNHFICILQFWSLIKLQSMTCMKQTKPASHAIFFVGLGEVHSLVEMKFFLHTKTIYTTETSISSSHKSWCHFDDDLKIPCLGKIGILALLCDPLHFRPPFSTVNFCLSSLVFPLIFPHQSSSETHLEAAFNSGAVLAGSGGPGDPPKAAMFSP